MIKTNDITINPDNSFENCKLNREQYADILTTVIESYKEGFVMAINNKWGEGKTTFVKMWKQKLKNNGYETLYFNAWENDFEDNALTAIIGELKSLSDKGNKIKEDFKELLKAGAVLGKNILPGLAKALVGKYVDVEELKSFVEAATKGMTEIFEEDVKEYANKKESIKDFKKKLEKFIKDATQDKPLIFVIDELDRCRPNYAVSVLEKVKHFFSVPGIVFILSIDKEQLGNAVKGVYGNDNIDADEYLRRFIDLEYSIPQPNNNEYCDYLFEHFDFASFFNSNERNKYSEFKNDSGSFLIISKILFNSKKITLRQQQRIFAYARLVLRTFNENQYTIPILYIYLIFIKIILPDFYLKLKLKIITIDELQINFRESISEGINETNLINLVRLEAYLVYFSYYYLSTKRNPPELLTYSDNAQKNCAINSKLDQVNFENVISALQDRHYNEFDIAYLLKRIELTEKIRVL